MFLNMILNPKSIEEHKFSDTWQIYSDTSKNNLDFSATEFFFFKCHPAGHKRSAKNINRLNNVLLVKSYC